MSYFTPEQVDQVVEYFRNSKKHNWMAPMVLIAANTGMRVGEILSIGPNTIFDNTKGKPYVHLMYTKNGDGRYVYLNAKARQALRELNAYAETFSMVMKSSFSTHCDTPLPQDRPMSLGSTTHSLPKLWDTAASSPPVSM
jgi:integrase